jgi:hypothetical protein
VKKEFIVERQGRSFVLYAGLLDMAHQQGLKSIRTELVQAPDDGNGRVAIAGAVVTLERDGVEHSFSAIGDAAPDNVAPAMRSALIRMAETRAKARALRDAVNVGVTAFEELADEEERPMAESVRRPQPGRPSGPLPASAGASTRPAAAATRPATSGLPEEPAKASADQKRAIGRLCRTFGVEPDAYLADRYGSCLEAITQPLASDVIRTLQAGHGRAAA